MIWKKVIGYDNYEVSESSLIRNIKTGRVLKQSPRSNKGYLCVCLTVNGRCKTHAVHIEVAKSHIPNPSELPQVNHIDEDKTNNEKSNLEWMTNQENCEHSSAMTFEFLNPDGDIVVIYNLNKFCKNHGLQDSNMHKVLSGEYTHHKGWRRI